MQASKNAAALAPDDAGVRVALGVTLIRGGRNAEAVEELQRALAVEPNHDEARRYLGRSLAALGRVDEAVAEWRKALALRPNNWQVLERHGPGAVSGGPLRRRRGGVSTAHRAAGPTT